MDVLLAVLLAGSELSSDEERGRPQGMAAPPPPLDRLHSMWIVLDSPGFVLIALAVVGV